MQKTSPPISILKNSPFTAEDFRALAKSEGEPCLSLYLPLQPSGRETHQAPILLKELRAQAANEGVQLGLKPDEIKALLTPVDRILAGSDYSLLQGSGLAILATPGVCCSFLLPFVPPALAAVDRHFHLDPLILSLLEKAGFYLLSLSLKSIRLWEGNRVALREIPLEGIVLNIKNALHWEDAQASPLAHSLSAPGGKGQKRLARYYSHGGGGEDKGRKKDILRFFRQVDKGIRPKLVNPAQPLILAGADFLIPIFREASSNSRILEATLSGNIESAPATELHARAWNCLEQERYREVGAALGLYSEGIASRNTASGLSDIVPSAYQGRIRHLFLRKGFRQWGTFDRASGKVTPLDSPRPGAEDLPNLACIHTLLGEGSVHILEGERMPEGSDIAALCRY